MDSLQKAKNLKYVGIHYFPSIKQAIPLYELKDIPDAEWNRRAKVQQIASDHGQLNYITEERSASCG